MSCQPQAHVYHEDGEASFVGLPGYANNVRAPV
jgi:hypothetical protein